METTQTAAPAAPATEKPKKETKPKVELLKQNGATRPRPGSKTVRPWEIADELSRATGKPAVRKDVIEKATAEGISPATAATQYGRWRRYNGLEREKKVEAPVAQAAAPAASDVSVETK